MRRDTKYLSLLLIVFSGLMILINHTFLNIRNNSILFDMYYKDPPIHKDGYNLWHNSMQDSFIADALDGHMDSKSLPIFHVLFKYTRYKDLIPRRAYYSYQLIDGVYQTVIIVLAEVSANVIQQNLIESCQLNGQYSTSVKVIRDPIMRWIQTYKKGYTHFFTIIHCLGFHIGKNSHENTITIVYRTERNTTYRSVNTENTLHVPSSPQKKNSLVVCSTMYGHPVRFDEWLRYHKTIGVDMIHVNAQVSFAVAMEQYPFLVECLANGFVKVEVWKRYLKKNEIFYHSQSLLYQDCLLRYRDSFEYAMMIDYDDFFIPVTPNKIDIDYYLKQFFNDDEIASIALPWIQYHCEPLNYSNLVDGNVTRVLSGQSLKKRLEFKSIHKLKAVEVVSIHKAYRTAPGYRVETLYGIHLAYIAHIRPDKPKCKDRISKLTQSLK